MNTIAPLVTPFALAGSQRWLQVALVHAPALLHQSLVASGAIDGGDSIEWVSPLRSEAFKEYRDSAALRRLRIPPLRNRSLEAFWPARGPVWDALGTTGDAAILLEAKAHIGEAASPGTKASPVSLQKIQKALGEARRFYAPDTNAHWDRVFYQHANRLAHQFLLRELNNVDSRLVFLYFLNARDVGGPMSQDAWHGATKLIHAALGLPSDLSAFRVHDAYVDVEQLLHAV
jgi:hypothetical protein